ncbi:MAG TPA: outer membrane beta-barrel protein [Sphingomonadaceae bacterium]|nr:outer membrane beta-barrel protein [Sphingomonadaceae bacterium]
MKKSILAALAASIALPGTAHAGETYIGLSGGVTFAGDSENQGEFTATVPSTPDWGAIPSGTSLAWNTEFETGYHLSGQLGYKFDSGLRAEIEAFYARSGVDTHNSLAAGGAIIDSVDVAVLTRGAPNAANPTVGEVIADGQGYMKTMGVFANLFYDFNTGESFQPYFGAGIGFQGTKVNFSPSGVPVAEDSDTGFAWQAMAGATFELSESVDLFTQFTYRGMFERADIPLTLLPATLGVKSDQALIAAGLRFEL